MTFGAEIKNLDGTTFLSDSLGTMALVAEGVATANSSRWESKYAYLPTNHHENRYPGYRLQIPIPSLVTPSNAMVFIQPGSELVSLDPSQGGSLLDPFHYIVLKPSLAVRYKVFTPYLGGIAAVAAEDPEPWGLELFDESGGKVFSSRYDYLNILAAPYALNVSTKQNFLGDMVTSFDNLRSELTTSVYGYQYLLNHTNVYSAYYCLHQTAQAFIMETTGSESDYVYTHSAGIRQINNTTISREWSPAYGRTANGLDYDQQSRIQESMMGPPHLYITA